MNELQVFSNSEFGTVRTLLIDGEPWAVGKDVATALGYKDTNQALRKHVDEEDKLTRQFNGSGQSRDMYIINESGLYSLILSSKLPGAKKFKRWITSEVLPAIRRTGKYAAGGATPPGGELAPADLLQAARTLAICRREQIPDVYHVLRQAGVSLPAASGKIAAIEQCRRALAELDEEAIRREAEKEASAEVVQLIDRARSHGMSVETIARITRLPESLIQRSHSYFRLSVEQANQCLDDLGGVLYDLYQNE